MKWSNFKKKKLLMSMLIGLSIVFSGCSGNTTTVENTNFG